MAHELEFFDDYFQHPENYTIEERYEMRKLWIEFMKENQEEYGFPDERIAIAEAKLKNFGYVIRLTDLVMRLMNVANKRMEEATARMDKNLTKAMESNGNKPIPMFPDLLKKRGGN